MKQAYFEEDNESSRARTSNMHLLSLQHRRCSKILIRKTDFISRTREVIEEEVALGVFSLHKEG